MSTASTAIVLGGSALAFWWVFLRKGYFVQGDRTYEYFDDLEPARDYARSIQGVLYEIPAGSEFSKENAKRLTPNRRRRRSRR